MDTSTYYYQPVDKTAKDEADQELVKEIEKIILELNGYGYRRVTKHLKRAGKKVNHKRVLRLMRKHGLIKRRRRRYVRTTDSKHSYQVYPNLVKELEVTKPNQVWVSDITYVRLLYEFVYLAAILDKYSRKAIGYALTDHIDSRLTLQALDMALVRRNPAPGCIHHSDRGVQYACVDYVSRLKRHGFLISMTRKGNPYENAEMESFFKTLKCEEVYLWEYRTLEEAQMRIDSFIREVYNKKRLHSSLGYVPPEEFEILHPRYKRGKTARPF
jgi:putative transposase